MSTIFSWNICCFNLYRGLKYFSLLLLAPQIIPPGVEFGHMIHDFDLYGDEDSPSPASEDPSIWFEVVKLSSDLYMQDFTYCLTYPVIGISIDLFIPPMFVLNLMC